MAAIDVILTVPGDASGLRATAESVLAQNLRDLRLVVVAGPGSEAASALDGLGDDRVVLLQGKRGSAPGLRNEALVALESPLVCFVKAGDRLLPAALAHLAAAARAGTHGAACGSWLVASGEGVPDGPPIDPPEGSVGLGEMGEFLGMPAAATVLSRDLIESKRFGANLGTWSHTDLWLRLCEDGVRWQVVPAIVAAVRHDPPRGAAEETERVAELRSVVERSFRRASARGWEDDRLDESSETLTVRGAVFEEVSRAALSSPSADGAAASGLFAPLAAERCLTPAMLASASAIALRYSASFRARIDGEAERAWAPAVHAWWSRCATQKWVARHEFDGAIAELAARLVDPRDVARDLLAGFGSPGRLWVGGTDRTARAVIDAALDAGWRVLVLPGRARGGVNTRLMALPSRVMVASGTEQIGSSDPLVIGAADEADLLERYGARPNVARWNGSWRRAHERAVSRLESAWPRRDL